ncbi:hypothetical protein G647_00374 [Cladophialophora carrionii CBS 160.54]|uniref:CorA-like transporter domain-containing protein n=1 Tax=Cladophialophora carrionii CBS 160.54 TaxID=1279043 RepID=V9DM39_9EURO|nr:uncharacterized protein G647_00374 [Cladophialophora carrionii CBS 160.54]ETI27925.1 hypothetical protein G647_00374 [Cladophialophora carrionii CBS 160.54]
MALAAFLASCDRAADYPVNLLDSGSVCPSLLQDYKRRLLQKTNTLFRPEPDARVELFYYDECQRSFGGNLSTSLPELKRHLAGSTTHVQKDKPCTFVFVGAPNARRALYISLAMSQWIFSVFQVLPSFLEFLFVFGESLYPVDSQFSGFREDCRLETTLQRQKITELERSGQDYQICYNLKSFERKEGLQWPWSCRQTVVFHAFDAQQGQATWITIKANDVIRERLKEASDMILSRDPSAFTTLSNKFANTLTNHLVVVEWCAETCRRYLSDIEENLQTIRRRAEADKVSNFVPTDDIMPTTAAGIPMSNLTPGRSWTLRHGSTRTNTAASQKSTLGSVPQPSQPLPSSIAVNVPVGYRDPPHLPPEYDPRYRIAQPDEEQHAYKIDELQQAQHLESHVSDAILVFKSNFLVLSQIDTFYRRLAQSQDLDSALRTSMQTSVHRFSKRMESVRNDLQMHLDRLDIISKLIAEYKNLLYGILEYQSMQANKTFALEARASAKRMEDMTQKMRDMTFKTTFETVLMRIITVVTVFFLPATFVSTMMSTDMVQYDRSDSTIRSGRTSLGAVKLFLCVTFSLMVPTFASGCALYWWALRRAA